MRGREKGTVCVRETERRSGYTEKKERRDGRMGVQDRSVDGDEGVEQQLVIEMNNRH